MGHTHKHALLGAIAACCLAAATHTAHAVDRDWNNDGSGGGFLFYTTATNWTPNGVPTAVDNLTFDLDAIYSIITGAGLLSANMNFLDGNVTLVDPGGATLTSSGVVTIDDQFAGDLEAGAKATWNGGTWDVSSTFITGDLGFGTFTVDNSGDITAAQFIIGNQSGSEGSFTATGAGVTLVSDSGLNNGRYTVGREGGTGTMTVSGGASATMTNGIGDIWVGELMGANGTLNIDGAGSSMTTEDTLIGFGGTGTLNITDGGVLNNTIGSSPDGTVATTNSNDSSTGSATVLIDGDNSAWNARNLIFGNTGSANVTISGGGKADTTALVTIGNQTGGSGAVVVTGSGTSNDSLLEVGTILTVGNTSDGTLTVQNGGDVTVGDDLNIGNNAASAFNNAVTVNGMGSSIAVTDVTNVGIAGKGTINVQAGATYNSTDSINLATPDGSSGTINVDGMGSQIITGNFFLIGNEGVGTLNITGGGFAQSVGMAIADSDVDNDNATPSSVLISESDGVTPSTLSVTGTNFTIGGSTNENGGVGQITVQNSGLLNSNGMFIGSGDGGGSDGTGTVTVTGADSFINAKANGTATVFVGDNGGGTLNVQLAGRFDAQAMTLGDEAGGETAVMDIDGDGSQVNVTAGVIVGNGRMANVTIINGGVLTSGTDNASNAVIGNGAAADGATVTVSGQGSLWDHQGSGLANHRIRVGVAGGADVNGNRSRLAVLSGGKVLAHDLLASDGGSGVGEIFVNGKDGSDNPSTVSADGFVVIGDDGLARLTVSGGGLFENATGSIEFGGTPSGVGHGTITGAGSTLSATGILNVGRSNDGHLTIADGGAVDNVGDGNISRDVGSSSTVTVGSTTANDSTWDNDAGLYVGGDNGGLGGPAVLTVNGGGVVNVGTELKLWNSATVNLSGGTITTATFDVVNAGSPSFNFNTGTFRYTGNATLNAEALGDLLGATPTLIADQELGVTGSATIDAPLRLNGGTLGIGSILDVSNLDFDAGTFNLTSDNLTVGAGGLFGAALTIDDDQTINVTNQVTVNASSELVVVGGFSSGGLTNNGDSAFIDTTGSGKSIDGTVTTPANSTVTLIGTITFNDAVSGAGEFFGPGTAVFNGGYTPGDSTAAVGFEGDVQLGANNTLSLELNNTTPGSGHDQLNVGGDVTVGGGVALTQGGVPSLGDAFIVITSSTLSGVFDHGAVTGADLDTNTALALLYEDGDDGDSALDQVRLFATYRGDANGDGTVSLLDLDALGVNFGMSGTTWQTADFNYDGETTLLDLDALGVNFNQSVSAPAPAVPEPATLVLLGLGGLALAGRRG